MTDVTNTADEVVNVWPYVEIVLSTEFAEQETDSWDVEFVYINQPKSYQHILINTQIENAYLVIVVDVIGKSIFGHHFLNLNQKYGLTS